MALKMLCGILVLSRFSIRGLIRFVCLWSVLLSIARPLLAQSAGFPTIKALGNPALSVQFTDLGVFRYQVVDLGTGATPADIEKAKQNDQVPAAIRSLHGQRIAMTGYLLPLKMEGELTKELILMKDVTTCCYGAVPQMNDYAVVTMKGKGLKVVQDIPVTLVGTLEVGERYEDGYLVSLFRMQGEGLMEP